MSAYKFMQRAVASPDAPRKPLVRKRARSGGAEWVQVTWHPAKQAKKPRTAGSQQPACNHKEHQILSTAEATAFANQFWDRKGKLKNYVTSHKQGDVCPIGFPALVERGNNENSDSE